MKKNYERPMIEQETLTLNDILTLSVGNNGLDDEHSWNEGI